MIKPFIIGKSLRCAYLLFLVLQAVLLAQYTAAGEQASSVIPNGGMEKDLLGSMPSGWIGFANDKANSATFKVSNTIKHSGNHSLEVNIEKAGAGEFWKIGTGPSGIPVKPNSRYNLSAWVYAEKGSKIEITANLRKSPWTVFASSGKRTLIDGWQQISFDAQVGETDDLRISMHLNYNENEGKTFYIDDVSLVLLP
ncbi:carbohydrate binding protein [Alteromonadaceae bacterium 2753L.S.0a.02]|nr:carbohydrate binding protein [Alteromonadaceae bacterium 2753L.S.0a.02]